jgi:translation elongation factor EF-1alpha
LPCAILIKSLFALQGIEEEDVSPGFVLCDASNPIKTGKIFDAQVVILEHKSIICAGYSAVMHIHCAAEEITVKVGSLKLRSGFSQLTFVFSSFRLLFV